MGKIKIIRNRKDTLIVLAMMFGSIVLIGGTFFLYDLWYPPDPVAFNFGQSLFMMVGFFLGLSFVIHGFHPLILFKSSVWKPIKRQTIRRGVK